MHACCRADYVEVARRLLDAGAPIGPVDSKGIYPLQNSSRRCARLLVERGACLHAKLPLHRACFDGNDHLVDVLLEAKASDIEELNAQGLTPLSVACRRGQHLCVQLLLARGASVSSGTSSTEGPLHHACFSGSVGCVLALLRAGAPLGVATNQNVLPVHVACSRKHPECVRLLIEHRTPLPFTALQIACLNGDHQSVALLLMGGAKDNASRLALRGACERGDLTCVMMMLQHGEYMDLKLLKECVKAVSRLRTQDASPLLKTLASSAVVSASRIGDAKCVKFVLTFYDRGLPLDAALLVGAAEGHDECVRALVEHLRRLGDPAYMRQIVGADANSPLVLACRRGALRCAQHLLDAGADPNAGDPCPLNAALEAPPRARSATLALLLRHGARPVTALERSEPALLRLLLSGATVPAREALVEAVMRAAPVTERSGALFEQLHLLLDAIEPRLSLEEEARVTEAAPRVGARIARERAGRDHAEACRRAARAEAADAQQRARAAADAAEGAGAKKKAQAPRLAPSCLVAARPPSAAAVGAPDRVVVLAAPPEGKRITRRAESRARAWEHARRKQELKLAAMAEEEWRLSMIRIGDAIARGCD